MGDAGCFSFYPTKNITTGDGGMVITRDRQVYERVKILSLHGMTADAWSRFVGGPTGYEVIAAGFKYNMTDLAASLGLPQLATIEERWRQREQVWLHLHRASEAASAVAASAARRRLAARLPSVYAAAGVGKAWGRSADDHRRAGCGEHWRRHPLRSRCISTPTTGSSSDLWIRISPTLRLWANAPSRCRSPPPCPNRMWTTWLLR